MKEYVLKITRKAEPDRPRTLFDQCESYMLWVLSEREPRGGFGRDFDIDWSASDWRDGIEALQHQSGHAEVAQRLGSRLRDMLPQRTWSRYEHEMRAASEQGDALRVYVELQGEELEALPWELMVIEATGQPLAELPDCLVYRTWPEARPRLLPEGRLAQRLLLAWSEESGSVPLRGHRQAMEDACEGTDILFDPERDVLAEVTLARLREALQRASDEERPVSVLHLLCHGTRGDSGSELVWSDGRGRGVRVTPADLRGIIGPFSGHLRCVILSTCRGADGTRPGRYLGGIARELHRVGVEWVIGARHLLSKRGSVTMTAAFYQEFARIGSVEKAFLAARDALAIDARSDWAGLVCYAYASEARLREVTVSALSSQPLRDRFAFDIPAVGRESVLEWLRRTGGDRLLTGTSGMGKTFLCRILAEDDSTYFVVDGDRDALARAIAEKRPGCVILDDARDQNEWIHTLIHLRRERKFDFRIVANCWPTERDEVMTALHIDRSQVCELEPMSRDHLREIILAAAEKLQVRISHHWQQLLIEQSENRPGLAVALTRAGVVGSLKAVWTGDVLFDAVCKNPRLVGTEERELLACLALGGNAGLSLENAARLLESTRSDVSRRLHELKAGGIVTPGRGGKFGRGSVIESNWQVRPPMLRTALVRRVFFGQDPSYLSVAEVMEYVRSRAEAVLVLMDVKARGADIPLPDIRAWVEQAVEQSGYEYAPDLWRQFASLSFEAARIVLDEHRSYLLEAAVDLLYYIPEETIDALLELDHTERVATPSRAPWSLYSDNHPKTATFKKLHRWIDGNEPGDAETVSRRRLLLDGIERWASMDGGRDTTMAMLTLVLTPRFDGLHMLPGSGRTAQFRSGYWDADVLGSIAKLWPRILRLLEAMPPQVYSYRSVQETIEAWWYLFNDVNEAQLDILQTTSERMLTDLASRCSLGRTGTSWVYNITRGNTNQSNIQVDEAFHLIYGETLIHMRGRDDYTQAERTLRERMQDLANVWSHRPKEEVLDEFLSMDREYTDAHEYGAQQLQDRAHRMAHCLTSAVENPVRWCEALIERGARMEIIGPFLEWSREHAPEAASRLLGTCLQLPAHAEMAIRLTLSWSEPEQALLERTLDALDSHRAILDHRNWWSNSIPTATMGRLLRHPSSEIRASAAGLLFLWDREIPSELREHWREAVLNADNHGNDLYRILRQKPELAVCWFERQLQRNRRSIGWLNNHWLALVRAFEREDRLRLLCLCTKDSCNEFLFDALFDDDATLYAEWLSSSTERNPSLHLVPLRRLISDHWKSMLIAALEHGYTSTEIAEYCTPQWWLTHSTAPPWSSLLREYEELTRHPDHRLRAIASVALDWAKHRAQEAEQETRDAELHGI